MSDALDMPRITCDGCGKTYVWKPELAGKRVKCKCGQVMTVPESMEAPAPAEEDLYDLAPAPEAPKPKTSRVPLAPVAPRGGSGGSSGARATVVAAGVGAVSSSRPAPAGLGYPTSIPKSKDRMSSDTLLDMKRDAYVPTALLLIGFALYVGYYAFKYQLSGTGIAVTSVGVGLMTAFKAALLIGFALVTAGPLGVSFGGIWTAILKLAAVAVFCDGVTTWVEAGVAHLVSGFEGFGPMLSFPVSLGVYWVLLIYLFSMDPGDSWMMVALLAVFDMIVRWVIVLLLLSTILNWGGVHAANIPTFGSSRASSMSKADPLAQEVEEMKQTNNLVEARQYIKDGHQQILHDHVESWYAAGCKNIWFTVSRDINGRTEADGVIVELPKDKQSRAKCYEILKQYYKDARFDVDAAEIKDQGRQYMEVEIRG